MKTLIKMYLVLGILGISSCCFAQKYAGYADIPAEGVGYATGVLSYAPGAGVAAPQNIPSNTLGEPDLLTTSLGRGGSIVFSLAPLSLLGDKTSAADFYIYEHKLYNSWDAYVSNDNEVWTKIEPGFSQSSNSGMVKGYDIDEAGAVSYSYIKVIDTSNESGSKSAGADIDAIVIAYGADSALLKIVDTDALNGAIFNLEQNESNSNVDVKIIDKQGVVKYIKYSSDDSLIPVALSVQSDFNCDDEKDINVLAIRKNDNVEVNIIKDMSGNDIKFIDNSLIK